MSVFKCLKLKKQLRKLDSKKQLIFGIICCEKMLPNYLAFQKDTGWGDIAPIRKALDYVWMFILNKPVDFQEIEKITLLCESVAPSSDDFTSLYVTLAQNTCFAVCSLLDYLLISNVDKIVQVATYAIDSIDLYIQETENLKSTDPLLEQKILKHLLMQRELRQQKESLNTVELITSIDEASLTELKKLWGN